MNPKPLKGEDGAIAAAAGVLIFAWLWQHHMLPVLKLNAVSAVLVLVGIFLVVALALGIRLVIERRHRLRPGDWDKMSGRAFEDQIVIWLRQCGYNQVVKTEYYDQGIDILAAKPGLVIGVQVKRSNRPVGVAAVRAAVAGLKSYGCNQAMVVTNAKFTAPAAKLAAANDCRLVNGEQLRAGLG